MKKTEKTFSVKGCAKYEKNYRDWLRVATIYAKAAAIL